LKKFIILLFVVSCTFYNGFSQDSIPNFSFENWKFMGWFENPEGWQTNNNQLMQFVEKDSDSYIGNLAMKINANGWAQVQLPIQYIPDKYVGGLHFYAKCHIVNTDQFSVKLYYLLKGTVIDSSFCVINSNLNQYTFFNTSWPSHTSSGNTADSVRIIIKGGTKSGNDITLDFLGLSRTIISINTDKFSKLPWKIFNQDHSLHFESINSKNESVISIISVTGQTVYSRSTPTQTFSITLNPGIYFYRITNKNKLIQSGKVVVN
jgi:hypothetical protein